MVLLRKRHAQSAPQNLPDTRGWQLMDFVLHLQPFSDIVKSNHTALRQGKTRQTAASAQRQNAAYLDYMHRVLQTMANPIRAEAEVIGDTHFGMKHTNDLELLVYLHSIQPDHLFLNGDIVDHLVIESRQDINPVQRAAIRRIRDMKKQGCEVVRLRGNHDLGANRAEGDPGYGGVPIYRAVKFMSGDGSSTLITHGDQFDSIVGGNSWLEHVGSRAYAWSSSIIITSASVMPCTSRIGLWPLFARN
jgi:predicted phosphodiesterase